MKKIIIGVVGALIGIIAVLGMMAPTSYKVERSIVVNKPLAFVFSELKFLKKQNEWSPWVKMDPNMKQEWKGEDGTVGFVASWSGNSEVGVGEQEIVGIIENERIDYALRFKEPMEDQSTGYLTVEAAGENQTKVSWGMAGDAPFPQNIICFVMNMEKMVGGTFTKGLDDLKAIIEKK